MKCYPFILLGFIWRCLFSPKKTLTDWGGEVFFFGGFVRHRWRKPQWRSSQQVHLYEARYGMGCCSMGHLVGCHRMESYRIFVWYIPGEYGIIYRRIHVGKYPCSLFCIAGFWDLQTTSFEIPWFFRYVTGTQQLLMFVWVCFGVGASQHVDFQKKWDRPGIRRVRYGYIVPHSQQMSNKKNLVFQGVSRGLYYPVLWGL